MQKFVMMVCAMFLVALCAGCGNKSGAAAPTTTLPTKISLVAADVTGKTFYSASNSVSSSAPVAYLFKADGTVEVGGAPTTDTWAISSSGAISWTNAAGATVHTFVCIQKETVYWLFYDAADSATPLIRFYFDAATAQAYLTAITAPNGKRIGGNIIGGALPAVFSNITTVAGTNGLADSTNGIGGNARFRLPNDVTTDSTHLYVADYKNNMIRKITFSNFSVSRLAGSPTGLPGNANSTDGTGNTATFSGPTGITTDGTYLYVADNENHTIRRVDKSSGATTLVAGSTASAFGAVDALNGTDARFNQPAGITTDGTNLYVADAVNHTIRKIVISSGAVVTLAGAAGVPGSTDSIDGTGATARFNQPVHITTDGTNLYVTDFKNSTIRKIVIATGKTTTIAGKAGTVGSADGIGLAATFNEPNGITTDGAKLYITDSANNSIRRIVLSTLAVTTIASTSSLVTIPEIVLTKNFNRPIGITTDGTSLYVTDSGNHTIRRLR